jgi:hypothetical protein
MRRLLAVVAVLPVSALLSGGACEPPVNNNNNNQNNNNNTPSTCLVDGITMPKPDLAALRPSGGAVDRSCIGDPVRLAQSAAVRLQGCIDIFGLGGRAKRGIKVAVFGDDQDPRGDAPRHGQVDIAVVEDANGLACDGADAGTAACISLGCSKKGAYVIDNIPVHIPLTMKVFAVGDDTVIDTYTFGIVFDHGDNQEVDGVVDYEANLIYRSTYDSIPTIAGRIVEGQQIIGDGVGRGVIAGEIHDCEDQIVQGATVTTSQFDPTTKVTYFDGDTEDPTPELTRLSTNDDGLYVILNATTAPGKETHTVAAGILEPGCQGADCQCVSLSARTVKAYPDSVSIVTLRGDLPVLN